MGNSLVSVSVPLRKKFVFAIRTSFCASHLRAFALGYYLTFVSSKNFDLSSVTFSKKSVFTNCSVLIDSCTVLHLPLYPFLFEFSSSKNLFERCVTVAYAYCMLFICHTELSEFDYYYYCTNAANENCDEFCVKEVFKCRERRMMQ